MRPLDALIWALLASCAPALDSGSGSRTAHLGAGTIGGSTKAPTLHGRFLHITDLHPDPFYKTYSSTAANAACHRKRGPAGYYGAETSACDSSPSLINATFDWIKHNIADEIDFVVWTGDSARHDNDEKIPRTQQQVIHSNEFVVRKFTEVFGKDEDDDDDPTNDYKIPIVPTFGNNDIMPHNIMLSGPNKWTKRYLGIWRGFIPEAQRHSFQQGGWFHVEVIPGKLAVISLNTMYFFSSNSGVDGCANKHEPGYEQFEWLRIQLQIMRDRGMSAILMGHVPPARVDSKESWEETCWQKYALWERQYRDVIVASLFGHMNIDHFMLQDFKQLKKKTKKGIMSSSIEEAPEGMNLYEDGEVTVASSTGYLLDLRDAWAHLPSPRSEGNALSITDYIDASDEDMTLWQKFLSSFSKSKKGGKSGKKPKGDKGEYLKKIGGKYAERYSVSLVAPSIVPNFFPTLRVFEYNITGLENAIFTPVHKQLEELESPSRQKPDLDVDFLGDDTNEREIDTAVKRKQKKKEHESLKKRKKYKFKVPKGPSKSKPPGPAYSPQSLTLTGYTQYFANLTHINNDFVESTVNDVSPNTIFGLEIDEDGVVQMGKWKEGKHGKHQGKKPRPKPHPKKFKFEVEYDTKTDKRYKLKDLTVRRFVDLAERIGHDAAKSKALESEEQFEEDVYSDEEDDTFSDDEEEIDAEKRKGKKHKKGKKGKKKPHKKNSAWYTFVKRAFVSTMDPSEIDELFGARDEEPASAEQEVIEL